MQVTYKICNSHGGLWKGTYGYVCPQMISPRRLSSGENLVQHRGTRCLLFVSH